MRPRICAVITDTNPEAIKEAASLVDLFEVRIDLIGAGWTEVAKGVKKPWIACLRNRDEGGRWQGDDAEKVAELMKAIDMGATIVDLELATPNLDKIVPVIKKRTKCLISIHDTRTTPPLDDLKKVVRRELTAGADIAKVVTKAGTAADNLTMLELTAAFPGVDLISLAMGPLGILSRVLSPLAGGYLTYASLGAGQESAPGQLTVSELHRIYGMVI